MTMPAVIVIVAVVVTAAVMFGGWCICRVAAWADERMELVNLDAELDRNTADEVDQ